MCLLNSHFTRGAASSLGQREAREGMGQARLQRAPLLCQIIQPMKKEGEVQSQAGAWGTCPASPALALELSVSQGVRYFLWTQCPLGTELPITAGTSRSLPPQEQVTGWEQRPVCPDTALLHLLTQGQPVPPVRLRTTSEEQYRNKKQAQGQGRVVLKWAQLSDTLIF